jgi:capsular exopolysaccharide synthesis family protein
MDWSAEGCSRTQELGITATIETMDKPNLQYGYEETNGGVRVQPTGNFDEHPVPTVDVYGAIWRRKSVIILMSLLGAGIASVLYTQATPVFASVLRLMLFVQAPPSVINGEVIPQQVALEKQRVLLSGQTVLADAMKKGQLDKLETFRGSDSPYGELRSMLKVSPVGKDLSSDSLEIQCEGTHKADLQGILNQVVQSYISAIGDDSETSGRESVQLIEKLQESLVEEQKRYQNRYYELLKGLNLTAENDKGRWSNPYILELEKLRIQRDELIREFRDADQLLEQVRIAVDPENPREELMRLAVIEAKKHFNVDRKDNGGLFFDPLSDEDKQRLSRYEQRMELANQDVVSLDAERQESATRYGARHPQVEFIEARYQAALATRNRLAEELDTLRAFLKDEEEINRKSAAMSQEVRTRDQDILQLYAASLLNQRERAKYNLDKVTDDIAELSEESNKIAGDIAELNMLRDQIDERGASVSQILDKLSAMRAMSGNYSATRVKIIDEASLPGQIYPKLWKFLFGGLLLGGLLGVGLAILIDHSDLAYRTPIDIQDSLNVPVICKIPRIKKGKVSEDFVGSPMLVTAYNPSCSVAETFRAARTSLLFTMAQTGSKVFMFTSPSPGDGKSTTVANLAISLAQTNKTVCLVDADYRRPRVQQNFGVQFEPGGMQYLLGECTLDEALRPCEFQANLTLLTTGGRPKNPGEIVASHGFADMLEQLKNRFDIVLIDSPPVIPVADTTAIASLVDGIIMVLRIRRGVILSAHKAKSRLDMVQANLVGVFVNGMDENLYYNEYGTYYRGAYYYGYNYGRYYDKQYADYSDNKRIDDKRSVKK